MRVRKDIGPISGVTERELGEIERNEREREREI